MKKTVSEGDGDPRHGTANGYGNLRCRCRPCTTAHSAYLAELEKKRSVKGLAPDDPRHGSENAYGNYGCRCRPCTDVWSAASTARKRRRDAAKKTGAVA